MKIGITEHGDAGLDFSWFDMIRDELVDGAILITKDINSLFTTYVTMLNNLDYKIIVHCTCTGWGSSIIEPGVPKFETQLENLRSLIDKGFPKERCVLRIDPIFPTNNGLKRVTKVIDYAYMIGLLPDIRVRISILDEYNHVKERFRAMGYEPLYEGFYAPPNMMRDVVKTLSQYSNCKDSLQFECCAEDYLISLAPELFIKRGCLSEKDLEILGLEIPTSVYENPQNRKGCHCMSCKKEILDTSYRGRCDHKCAYCFWKD